MPEPNSTSNLSKRDPSLTPREIYDKMMCIHCTRWLPFCTWLDQTAFDLHQKHCTKRQCGNCEMVMVKEDFWAHAKVCWVQRKGQAGRMGGEGMNEEVGGIEGEGERAEWDTEYLRRAFGEIE
jgi:hypothetical protein